jgi:hypothetical protein
MSLSSYHQQYAQTSDEEIERKIWEKEQELTMVFGQVSFQQSSNIVRVAVLGCGDKRFVKAHKLLFERFVQRLVALTTFDITIDHLVGEENIVAHDCTLPLPSAPYDICFSHVLLKFIAREKQWDVLKNSYDALAEGGLAIHILNREELEEEGEVFGDGFFTVPLGELRDRLTKEGILHTEVRVKHGVALVLMK